MKRRSARRRPNYVLQSHRYWPCARERAGRGAALEPAPPRPPEGDRVRARNDRNALAICRVHYFQETPMTVYLLWLALAGLVAIGLGEALS